MAGTEKVVRDMLAAIDAFDFEAANVAFLGNLPRYTQSVDHTPTARTASEPDSYFYENPTQRIYESDGRPNVDAMDRTVFEALAPSVPSVKKED